MINLHLERLSRQRKNFPNFYDAIAFILIMTVLALIAMGASGMHQTLAKLQATPIELSLVNLPKYALYTTLRMFAAIFASLVFTFFVATLAAKNKKAEMIIIPALDILQSVPILGFLTFTVTIFMGLFPGEQLGVELAAIFVIFTSQAWNMAFSFYQSLRTVPQDLKDVCEQFSLNSWQRFWQLEVPFAIPGLVWNTMMSMSGGWFFVVASEAIVVGNTQIALPGIGSWLALAINHKNLAAVGWAVLAMGIIILLYNQLLFRPIIAWADKFKMERTASQQQPKSWLYTLIKKSDASNFMMRPFAILNSFILQIPWPHKSKKKQILPIHSWISTTLNILWFSLIYVLFIFSILFLTNYLYASVTSKTVINVFLLGTITATRVIILIALASLVWVPLGVWIGLRPKLTAWIQPLAQFLAAFPANILFPIFVIMIVKYDLNPDIWISPLMILGTQWYIFFNVIAGVSVFPNDLKESCTVYNIRKWLWWRKIILPAIFPYYITGALTASGGAWNASIVAEVIQWGSTRLEAHGLGAFIASATQKGNTHEVVLGIAVMSIFVIVFNRLIWRRLYTYAAQYTHFD